MLFLFRSAPEVEKRIHSKLFRKFWRSRGTKEPAYITVCSFFLCQTEEVGIKIYVGKAIKRPPPDRAIGPCLTELDKWEHLAPQNEQSRYEKKMILADTDNWNHIIMSRYKKT